MKRFGEKFKQAWGLGSSTKEGQWRPTSNGRNAAMLADVRAFAQQLKNVHKEVKVLSDSMDSGMMVFKAVLLSPLPRAYDEVPAGVLPVDRDQHLIGLNVNAEGLVGSSREVKERLQQEVLVPLEQWLTEYRNTKATFRKCEELRLDLDNKRRTVLALQDKYKKLKDLGHKDADSALHKVVTEEDKLARLAQRYADQEAQVFNAFLQIIRDSAMLRDFVALALAIIQRGFTGAYSSFDIGPPPERPVTPPILGIPTPLPGVPAALPPPSQVPMLTYAPQVTGVAAGPMAISASMRASTGSTGSVGAPVMSSSPLSKAMSTRHTIGGSLGPSPSFATHPAAITSAVATAHLQAQPSLAHAVHTGSYSQPPAAHVSYSHSHAAGHPTHAGSYSSGGGGHMAPHALPPPQQQPYLALPAPPSPNDETMQGAAPQQQQQQPLYNLTFGRAASANGGPDEVPIKSYRESDDEAASGYNPKPALLTTFTAPAKEPMLPTAPSAKNLPLPPPAWRAAPVDAPPQPLAPAPQHHNRPSETGSDVSVSTNPFLSSGGHGAHSGGLAMGIAHRESSNGDPNNPFKSPKQSDDGRYPVQA